MKELNRKVKDHWEENLRKAELGELTADDISGKACAWCQHFRACIAGCPMCSMTGRTSCGGTAYDEVDMAVYHNEKEYLVEHVKKFISEIDSAIEEDEK